MSAPKGKVAFSRIAVFALHIDDLDGSKRNCGVIAKRDLLRQAAAALMHIPAHLGDLRTHFDTGLFLALLHNTDAAAMTATAELTLKAVRDLAVPRSLDHRKSSLRVSALHMIESRVRCSRLPFPPWSWQRGEGGDRIHFA